MAKRVAIIDIGSNSLRMVVYERSSRFGFHILHEAKSRARISERAYLNDHYLQDEPMRRTLEALSEFRSIARSFKATKTLCIATSALRDAPNRSAFRSLIKAKLGINIKIIDGEMESYLASLACINLLPTQESALMVDLGGGSCEFAMLSGKEISQNISLQLGSVRIKELFLDKNDLKGATAFIDKELEKVEFMGVKSIVGVGGTFRAITKLIQQNSSYPLRKIHAFEMNSNEFKECAKFILQASSASELKSMGIASSRLDVIQAGSLILLRILKKFKAKQIISSRAGVREGLFLKDLLRNSKHRFPHNFNPSIKNIMDRFVSENAYANMQSRVAKDLFDLFAKNLKLNDTLRSPLSTAAKLLASGSSVDYYTQNTHSRNILLDLLEYGFTHKERLLIATLASIDKKGELSYTEAESKLLPKEEILKKLATLLLLSQALLAHRPRSIDFELRSSRSTLIVESKNSMYLAKEQVLRANIKFVEVEFKTSAP